jgi:O-antigen ligase
MIIPFAPLFFGAVHTWAFSILNLLIFAAALYHLARRVTGRDTAARVKVPALPWYIAFIAITTMQLIPLPPALLSLLSPTAGHIHGATDAFLDLSSWRPLSLIPFATTVGLVKALAYGTLFILLVHTCRDKDKTTSLVRTLIFLGAVLALYGLFEKLSGHDHIWWFKSNQHGSFRVTGTFINPDHFGTFLAMLVPLSFGYVYRTRITAPLPEQERRRLSLFKRTMTHLFDPEAGAQKAGLLLFLCGMMAVALIMTGSRGAILALGGGFLVMSVLVLAKTRRKGFALLMGAALVVVAVYGAQIGIDQSLSRFSRMDMGMNGRVAFLTHAWVVMKHFLLTGTGLGTFPEVFVPFTPDSFARVFVNQLHNDWAEILFDTGLPGFICLIGGFTTLMLTMIRTWWTRTNPFAVGIGLGAIGSLTAAAIHSLADFGLRMPGNAVIFVAVAAAGWSAMTGKKKTRVKRKRKGDGRRETEDGRQETGGGRREKETDQKAIDRPLAKPRSTSGDWDADISADKTMSHGGPSPRDRLSPLRGASQCEPRNGHNQSSKSSPNGNLSCGDSPQQEISRPRTVRVPSSAPVERVPERALKCLSQFQNSRIPEPQNPRVSSSSPLPLNPLPLILAVILIWAIYTTTAVFRADLACSTERNSTLNRDMAPDVASIQKAISLTPDNGLLYAKLGVALAAQGPEQGESKRAHQTRVQKAWERAVALRPVDGKLWYRLSLSYGRVSTRTWTRQERRTRRDTATLAATLLRPQDGRLLAQAGRYFAWRAGTLPDTPAPDPALPELTGETFTWWRQWHEQNTLPLPATSPQALTRAARLMRTGIARNRGLWKQCAQAMWKYTKDEAMVRSVVPEGNTWVNRRMEKWLKELKKTED